MVTETYSGDEVRRAIKSGDHARALMLLRLGVEDIIRVERIYSPNKSLRGDIGRLAYLGVNSVSDSDWRTKTAYFNVADKVGYKPLVVRLRDSFSDIGAGLNEYLSK